MLIASICTVVLSFPPRFAGTTPAPITVNLIQVITISRTMMMIVTHHGSSPRMLSEMNATPVSALSAMGSHSSPNAVI